MSEKAFAKIMAGWHGFPLTVETLYIEGDLG